MKLSRTSMLIRFPRRWLAQICPLCAISRIAIVSIPRRSLNRFERNESRRNNDNEGIGWIHDENLTRKGRKEGHDPRDWGRGERERG